MLMMITMVFMNDDHDNHIDDQDDHDDERDDHDDDSYWEGAKRVMMMLLWM